MLSRLVQRSLPRFSPSLRQSGVPVRGLARESKEAFEPPPDPPSTKSDKWRWIIVFGGVGLFGYIYMQPENNYGIDFGGGETDESKMPVSRPKN
jgi:hypothetical protein